MVWAVCATMWASVSLESVERQNRESEEMGAKEGTNQSSLVSGPVRSALRTLVTFRRRYLRLAEGQCKRKSRLRVCLYRPACTAGGPSVGAATP